VQPVSAVPPVSAVLQVSEVSAVKEGSATLPLFFLALFLFLRYFDANLEFLLGFFTILHLLRFS
jgi:hypothetical protein